MNKKTVYRMAAFMLGLILALNSGTGLAVLADEYFLVKEFDIGEGDNKTEIVFEEDEDITEDTVEEPEEAVVIEESGADNTEQNGEEIEDDNSPDSNNIKDKAENPEEIEAEADTESEKQVFAWMEIFSVTISSEEELREVFESIEPNHIWEITVAEDFTISEAVVLNMSGVSLYFSSPNGATISLLSEQPHIIVDRVHSCVIKFENVILDGSNIGGGIHIGNYSNIELTGVHIRNCYSEKGGGLSIDKSEVAVLDSIIENNYAKKGGGVSATLGNLYCNNVVIQNNHAYSEDTDSAYGGGLFMEEFTFVNLSNTIVAGNSADTARTLSESYGYGGGIAVEGDSQLLLNDGAWIQENRAMFGGGIYKDTGGLGLFDDFKITNNSLTHNGGAGAGIMIAENAYLFMWGGEITNNYASDSGIGGGIYFGPGSRFEMWGGNISENEARLGGGIYIEGGNLDIRREALLIGNKASRDGGAIYMNESESSNAEDDILLIMGEAAFTNNQADRNGGAIWVWDLNVLDVGEDVLFHGNEAGSYWLIPDEEDIILHEERIKTDKFSNGFQYGFNNYDIRYGEEPEDEFFTVDFLLNYDENDIYHTAYITVFEELLKPEDPNREDWLFNGWFLDQQGTVAWDFDNDVVDEDMALYAAWIEAESDGDEEDDDSNNEGDEDNNDGNSDSDNNSNEGGENGNSGGGNNGGSNGGSGNGDSSNQGGSENEETFVSIRPEEVPVIPYIEMDADEPETSADVFLPMIPKTGDTKIILYCLTMLLSLACITPIIARRRK